MAYDEATAERVRAALKRRRSVVERKMFGGLAFMLDEHMCCGVLDDALVLRLGEEGAKHALKRKHTRPMDFTGRPMKSMVFVDAAGIARDDALLAWIDQAVMFARSLPKKS